MSPMTGRLRVVGTVELGGLSPKISQHRIKHLEKGAEYFFQNLVIQAGHGLDFALNS